VQAGRADEDLLSALVHALAMISTMPSPCVLI